MAVGNMALALQGIRLMHKQQLWLEGDALLPLDVWRKWPNTSLDSLLNDDVQSKVALTAYNLELGAASKLAGWNFPIAGVVNGNVTAEGPLGALKSGGKLALTDAKLPLGSSGESLTGVAGEVTFDAQTMTIARLVGQHPTGDFRAVGKVDLKNVRDPAVQALIESDKSEVMMFRAANATTPPLQISASLKLQLDGRISEGSVRGTATVTKGQIGGEGALYWQRGFIDGPTPIFGPNVSNFWSNGGADLPPVFPSLPAPWGSWSFDVTATGGPVHLSGMFGGGKQGTFSNFDIHLIGKGNSPTLTGSVLFHEVSFIAADVLMPFSGHGSVTWRDGVVFLDARATGELHDREFTAHLLGPIGKPLRFFEFAPPLTETLLNDALAGRYRAIPSLETITRFAFHAPSALIGDVPVFDWTIPDPPVESAAQ